MTMIEPPPHLLPRIRAFHDDTSWMRRLQRHTGLDDAALADWIACFFRDKPRHLSPVALPDWIDTDDPVAYVEKRNKVCAARGWNHDTPSPLIMHYEYMARAKYKEKLHLRFLELLEEEFPAGQSCRLLDFGCGLSSFGRLALTHATTQCTFADINPDVLTYLHTLCEEKWPGQTETHLVPSQYPPYPAHARIRIDPRTIPGCYDIIILADVLEHTLDPLGILLHLFTNLRPGGFLFISYPDNIEGDWHTPEANHLRPWCMRLLTQTCTRRNPTIWQYTPSAKTHAVHTLCRVARPLLNWKARRFARTYFHEHGNDIIQNMKAGGRTPPTLAELFQSIG